MIVSSLVAYCHNTASPFPATHMVMVSTCMTHTLTWSTGHQAMSHNSAGSLSQAVWTPIVIDQSERSIAECSEVAAIMGLLIRMILLPTVHQSDQANTVKQTFKD